MIGSYQVGIVCDNCGMPNKLNIKKGLTVEEFVSSEKCKCKNCGVKASPKEYRTKWLN